MQSSQVLARLTFQLHGLEAGDKHYAPISLRERTRLLRMTKLELDEAPAAEDAGCTASLEAFSQQLNTLDALHAKLAKELTVKQLAVVPAPPVAPYRAEEPGGWRPRLAPYSIAEPGERRPQLRAAASSSEHRAQQRSESHSRGVKRTHDA